MTTGRDSFLQAAASKTPQCEAVSDGSRGSSMKTMRFASLLLLASSALAIATPAQAQSNEELRSEVADLKARIERLEAALAARDAAATSPAPNGSPQLATQQGSLSLPAAAANPAGGATPSAPPAASAKRLTLNGDMRLRYESNFGRDVVRNRDRGVFRARLRANYAVNSWLTAGSELSTGDANDPNSTDITLTRFDDDLTVSLSQAYLKAQFGDLTLTGG